MRTMPQEEFVEACADMSESGLGRQPPARRDAPVLHLLADLQQATARRPILSSSHSLAWHLVALLGGPWRRADLGRPDAAMDADSTPMELRGLVGGDSLLAVQVVADVALLALLCTDQPHSWQHCVPAHGGVQFEHAEHQRLHPPLLRLAEVLHLHGTFQTKLVPARACTSQQKRDQSLVSGFEAAGQRRRRHVDLASAVTTKVSVRDEK